MYIYVYMYDTNGAFGGMEEKVGTNYKVGGGWWMGLWVRRRVIENLTHMSALA